MNLEIGTTTDGALVAAGGEGGGVDLGLYAAEVQELVLYLRDEGHVLSSMDQHVLEGWWQAGYPLEVVLRTVRERAIRLKARKKPPRGLPLRALGRYVEKAGEKALMQRVGCHGSASVEAAQPAGDAAGQQLVLLSGLVAEVYDAIALRGPAHPSHQVLVQLLAELEVLPAKGPQGAALFTALLAMGRRYYDALWQACSAAQQAELRGLVLASLGPDAGRMSGDALAETLAELCRRELRGRDPLFDPERYWKGL